MEEEGEEDVGGQVTTQETGWARAWLRETLPANNNNNNNRTTRRGVLFFIFYFLHRTHAQRRSEFVGRWERAEVRRVDEGVVAAGERGEINVGVFGRDSEGGEGGKQKKRSLHMSGLVIQ